MKTDWISELNGLKNEQSKIAKKISLLEEIIRLEGQHVAPSEEKKSKRTARTRSADNRTNETGKQMKLPDLLKQIGQQHSHPMKYHMFAQFVQESGYKTNSVNLNSMVYQALQKLVDRNVFSKNPETREYQYIGASHGVSTSEIGRHNAIDDDFDDEHDDKPSRRNKKVV